MERQIEIEKSPIQMRDLMMWCRDNGIPALVCYLTVVSPDDGFNWVDVNHYVGTRSYRDYGSLLTDPIEDNEPTPFFVRVRDRDRELFKIRAL